MAKKKTYLYPGIDAAEKEREKKKSGEYKPDLIETVNGYCPNYDKFSGWDAERVLAWCNID